MLESPAQTREILAQLDKDSETAILGLNDNIVEGYDEVASMLQTWFETRWSKPAKWEAGSHPS